jgi:hypothetical protein
MRDHEKGDMARTPGEVTISIQFARHLAPRFSQAGVTLSFEPAAAFEFSSLAEWPQEDCTGGVREGVVAGLRDQSGDLPCTRVVLKRVVWHEVDSSRRAFEMAARAAATASLTV